MSRIRLSLDQAAERARTIITLKAGGLRCWQIANRLNISVRLVRTYLRSDCKAAMRAGLNP